MGNFFARALFALAALGLAGAALAADEYPSRPIRIIVPYAAGGGADILSRLIGQRLSERLKQPVLVENQGGGSNTIGMGNVKRADADGYTLGLATPVFVTAPLGMKAKAYDALADFTPVAMFGFTPLILVVHPSVAAKTVREFIALAKAKPGSLNFASLGAYTTQGLAATHFNWLVISTPLNRVMLCGDAELPAQADLDRYADAGTRAFLAAYAAT